MLSLPEILCLVKDLVLMTAHVMLVMLAEVVRLVAPPAEKNVTDRLVLITGAAGSLGRELALQLCAQGCRLVLTDVNESELSKTAKLVEEIGGEVYTYTCDVTRVESVKQFANKVNLQIGQVSMLIHCAGIYKHKALLDHSEADVKSIIDVNVMGTIWLTRAFLGPMVSSNAGEVVLVSSVLGVMGRGNLAPYCASKFAITGFADALNQELKEKNVDGVTVSIVHPFLIGNITDVSVNIKVPGIFDILSPEEAARRIIQGVRRGEEEIFLPGKLKPLMRINRALPRKVREVCQKYIEESPSSS